MRRYVGVVALSLASVVACRHENIVGVGGLNFAASTVVAAPPAGRISTIASVTNATSAPIMVHYGACTIAAQLHTGGYDGPVVYDPRPARLCAANLVRRILAPSESLTFSEDDFLLLPSGIYFVTVVIDVNGSAVVKGGTIFIQP